MAPRPHGSHSPGSGRTNSGAAIGANASTNARGAKSNHQAADPARADADHVRDGSCGGRHHEPENVDIHALNPENSLSGPRRVSDAARPLDRSCRAMATDGNEASVSGCDPRDRLREHGRPLRRAAERHARRWVGRNRRRRRSISSPSGRASLSALRSGSASDLQPAPREPRFSGFQPVAVDEPVRVCARRPPPLFRWRTQRIDEDVEVGSRSGTRWSPRTRMRAGRVHGRQDDQEAALHPPRPLRAGARAPQSIRRIWAPFTLASVIVHADAISPIPVEGHFATLAHPTAHRVSRGHAR